MPEVPALKYRPSSRRRKPIQDTRRDSYRHGLVWRWLNEGVRAGPDPVGAVVGVVRKRIDMPRSFPTRTHMHNYLARCGLGPAYVNKVIERMWTLYRDWVEFQKSSGGTT